MNKTVKIIIGVALIAALVAGGLYFGGVAGDGGQGLLKKKNFNVDYGEKIKLKDSESFNGLLQNNKQNNIPKAPESAIFVDPCINSWGEFDVYKCIVPRRGKFQENGKTCWWTLANEGDSVEKVLAEYDSESEEFSVADAKLIIDPRWNGVIVKWCSNN